MRRVVRGVATTAALVLCAVGTAASRPGTAPAVGAPAASKTYAGRIGLDTSTIGLPVHEAYANLREARAGGVTWVREDFPWNYMEPQDGQFVWTYTDGLMRNAAQLGINVLAVVDYSAGWASRRADSFKYPPADPRAYALFIRLVVDRYGRGGTFWRKNPSQKPRPLKAVEIWNEPWHHDFWKPEPDPAQYARLVRVAATAVKSVHPEVAVLASADVFETRGDTVDHPDWFTALLKADPLLWRSRLVDGWSVHPYCQTLSPLDETANPRFRFDRVLLTRDLARRVGASKPIWITEVGWRADEVGEQTQALYTRLALQRANEWRGFVARTFIYSWSKPANGADQYNLIRPDGSTRPAWKEIRDLLMGAPAHPAGVSLRLGF